jgi:hypothetical protein
MRVDEALLLIKDQDLAVEIEALDDLAADIQKKMIENEIPEWHKRILEDRLANPKRFIPWEQARTEIRREIAG